MIRECKKALIKSGIGLLISFSCLPITYWFKRHFIVVGVVDLVLILWGMNWLVAYLGCVSKLNERWRLK